MGYNFGYSVVFGILLSIVKTNGGYHHLMIYSMALLLPNPYTKYQTVFSFIMPVTVFFFRLDFSVPSCVAAVVTRRSLIKMICSGKIPFLERD